LEKRFTPAHSLIYRKKKSCFNSLSSPQAILVTQFLLLK
jgi:hypothetical protein